MKEFTLQRIKELVSAHTGVSLCERDDEALKKMIHERLRLLKLSTPEEYCQLLDSGADHRREQEQLSILLTTGETYFFRDKGQFALLRETILPELIERRKAERALRIWSAACASGEEAYSLAMLLNELLPQQADWNLFILGTDINAESIEKARRGFYSPWSFRMIEVGLQQKHFRPHKDAWQLDARIRGMVQFRVGNLLTDKFPDAVSDLHDMDLILCRNMFIYFEPDAVARIAAKLADTLAQGGYLITGHGELHARLVKGLRARMFPESVAYQKISDFGLRSAELKPTTPIMDWGLARRLAVSPSTILRTGVANPNMTNVGVHASHQPAKSESAIQTPQSANETAWQYANLGNLDKAAQSCREAIKIDRFHAEPYHLLALIAQERGDLAEAKSLLKQAIYLDPAFIAAYLELGEIYARENDAPRARKMRANARDILKTLPAETPVAAMGASTAGEILLYLEKQNEVT